MTDEAEIAPPSLSSSAYAFVLVTVLLDMLALGVVIPVLPKLVLELGDGDMARAAQVTGAFMFVWALAQFICAPIMGAPSDRLGRRPVILMSNLGLGLDSILMALAPTLGWLFVARVISGITSASAPTATAYIADTSPPEKRASRFGLIGAAFGLGFIIGPAFGGYLGSFDLRLPFWAAATLSLLNFTYGLFVLPESLPPAKRSAFSWTKANPLRALTFLKSGQDFIHLTVASFLFFLAHESLPSVFVLYADHRYGWDERTVGAVLTGVGISTTLVSALLVGPIVKRLGEHRATLLALTSGTVGFSIYGLAPTGRLFLVGIPFVALMTITGPAIQSIMTRRVRDSDQGLLQGALGSLRGLTGMIGPVLFTQSFALAIDPALSIHAPGTPYLISAILMVFSASACLAGRATTTDSRPPPPSC